MYLAVLIMSCKLLALSVQKILNIYMIKYIHDASLNLKRYIQISLHNARGSLFDIWINQLRMKKIDVKDCYIFVEISLISMSNRLVITGIEPTVVKENWLHLVKCKHLLSNGKRKSC